MWQPTESNERRPNDLANSARMPAQSLVEYGLIIAVMAVAILGAIQAFGGGISAFFTRLLAHFAGLG